MSEESPAAPAVAADAGDSRAAAADPKPDSTTAESAPKQDEGKSLESGENPTDTAEKHTENAQTAAEPAETNGKEEPASTTTTEAQPEVGASTPKPSSAKRKSTGGASSAKKKKSQQRVTHLNAAPGEYYLARLKSFPPWPSIICDEEMLPQSLLNTRPVTTKQADGTYKEAYADGGKRVQDRTFPIMFLETNEFAWIPNTDLTPLDPEQCKNVSEKGKQKQLIAAYKVAAEGKDLQYFKSLLADHQRAIQQEAEEREAAAAEKAALKAEKEAAKEAAKEEKKKKKRKSVAAETEDVEMADADDGGKKPKSAKKRKKDAESDAEGEKPNKTPKTTKLKLTTPKDPDAAQKPKASKAKKATAKTSEEPAEEAVEEPAEEVAEKPVKEKPEVTPEEARAIKQKRVLFLRHKLQKGFLSRDQSPKEEEMEQMSGHLAELETFGGIEVSIIRQTKIQKVLRAIVKLPSIPKEEQYHFKQRAIDIQNMWRSLFDAEIPTSAAAPSGKDAKAETNGVDEEAEEAASAGEPKAGAGTEAEAKTEAAKAGTGEGVKEAEAEDKPMPDAAEAPEESKEKPTEKEAT